MLTQLTQQLLGAVHEPIQHNEDHDEVLTLRENNNQLNTFIDQSHQAYNRTIAELQAKLSTARVNEELNKKFLRSGLSEQKGV